ncbi:unnamed protein product, partial [Hapterophycus canaliculatus]
AQPALALSLLQELGLAPTVYNPPEHLVPSPADGGIDWARGAAVARAVASVLDFRRSTSQAESQGESVCLERDSAGELASLPAAEAEHGEDENARKGTAAGKVGTVRVEPSVAPGDAGGAGEAHGGREASPHGVGHVASCPGANKVNDEGSDGRTRGEQAPATLVREIFLCAALMPLAGVKHKAKKGKLVSAPQSIVAESLKLKTKEAKHVGDILELAKAFRPLADAYISTWGGASTAEANVEGEGRYGESAFSRLSVGLAVRQAKELWPTCVDLCCAMEMCDLEEEERGQEHGSPPRLPPSLARAVTTSATGHRNQAAVGGVAPSTPAGIGGPVAGSNGDANRHENFREGGRARSIIEKYMGLRKAVARMGLERAWEMAPLLR